MVCIFVLAIVTATFAFTFALTIVTRIVLLWFLNYCA